MTTRPWLRASLAVAVCGLSAVSSALAADEKVYYKDGVIIDTKDVNMKLNFLIQPNFTYTDYDSDGRSDLEAESPGDAASFHVRRARWAASGDILGGEFSYMLYHDFRADGGGSEMQDAYLQYNGDWGHLRGGQFDVPFSRQELNTDYGLQMIDRSIVSDRFSPARQMGAMAYGPVAEGVTWAAGAFNGLEGQNQGGVDNKLLYSAALTASTSGYGNRWTEGDLRDDADFDATGGTAAYYLEGSNELSDVSLFGLNVDLGARCHGFSAQTEFYYENLDFDSDIDSADNFGFYVQAGQMLNKQWELAARFGYIEPDTGADGDDIDTQSYELVVNYFLKGHALKLQTGVLFVVDNIGDDDVSDFQFATQLTGFI